VPETVGRRPRSIALDGPAAAGKTTVGRLLAERLRMRWLDTGLLYRAVTAAALAEGLPPEDEATLMALLERRPLRIVPRPGSAFDLTVTLGGVDMEQALRDPAVDANVSAVARHEALRSALLATQRAVAREHPVIMLGRDIGTVVLPDADLKLYLDASAEARARRRLRERLARGEAADFRQVLADMVARDAKDRGRSVAPLAVAATAVVVDTDRCDLAGVVAHLLVLVGRWPDALTTGGGRAACGSLSDPEGEES
jgi:cytidylate kinase